MSTNVKQQLIELVQRLLEDCSWDEVMYQIYVLQKIDSGLADAKAGRIIDEEELFAEYEPIEIAPPNHPSLKGHTLRRSPQLPPAVSACGGAVSMRISE